MRRILYSILLVLAVVFNAQAYDFSAVSGGHTLYYNILSGTNVELAACEEGATGALVIPGTVSYNGETYTVTTIGTKAFEWFSGLTGTLTIPNTVTTINASAFAGCTGFTGTLSLPSTLTTIGDNAFYGCTGITGTLQLPTSLTSLGRGAFYNCSGLTGDLVIPNGVTQIKAHTFRGCVGLNGTLTLPDNLTTIGEYAFKECTGLQGELNIPSKVTKISAKAFYNCSGFTGTLGLPSTISTMEEGVFYGCSGLTGSVSLPEVNTVEIDMFKNCSGLDGTLTISSKTTEIKNGAFNGCSSISSIVVKAGANPPTIGVSSFEGIADNTPLHVFCGMTEAFNNATNWDRFTNVIEDFVFTVNAISDNEEQGSVQILEVPTCENSGAFSAKAIPSYGYDFDKWQKVSGTGSIPSGTANNIIYCDTLKKDWTIKAVFKTKTASVISLDVYPEGSGTAEIEGSSLNLGDTITVTANANSDYMFDYWTEEDEIVSYDIAYSFISSGDRTLVAHFHYLKATIDVVTNPENSALITGTGEYYLDETVTLTAAPYAGFVFAAWYDADGHFISTDETISVVVEQDMTYTALLYSLTDVAENNESISIYPNPTHDVLTINGIGIKGITVNNTLGQAIIPEIKQDVESQTIDLTNQPNGVYIVRIVTTNGIITKKIVKE